MLSGGDSDGELAANLEVTVNLSGSEASTNGPTGASDDEESRAALQGVPTAAMDSPLRGYRRLLSPREEYFGKPSTFGVWSVPNHLTRPGAFRFPSERVGADRLSDTFLLLASTVFIHGPPRCELF
jgi:hypothetical protein